LLGGCRTRPMMATSSNTFVWRNKSPPDEGGLLARLYLQSWIVNLPLRGLFFLGLSGFCPPDVVMEARILRRTYLGTVPSPTLPVFLPPPRSLPTGVFHEHLANIPCEFAPCARGAFCFLPGVCGFRCHPGTRAGGQSSPARRLEVNHCGRRNGQTD